LWCPPSERHLSYPFAVAGCKNKRDHEGTENDGISSFAHLVDHCVKFLGYKSTISIQKNQNSLPACCCSRLAVKAAWKYPAKK
jgi:hypothetical protein